MAAADVCRACKASTSSGSAFASTASSGFHGALAALVWAWSKDLIPSTSQAVLRASQDVSASQRAKETVLSMTLGAANTAGIVRPYAVGGLGMATPVAAAHHADATKTGRGRRQKGRAKSRQARRPTAIAGRRAGGPAGRRHGLKIDAIERRHGLASRRPDAVTRRPNAYANAARASTGARGVEATSASAASKVQETRRQAAEARSYGQT